MVENHFKKSVFQISSQKPFSWWGCCDIFTLIYIWLFGTQSQKDYVT